MIRTHRQPASRPAWRNCTSWSRAALWVRPCRSNSASTGIRPRRRRRTTCVRTPDRWKVSAAAPSGAPRLVFPPVSDTGASGIAASRSRVAGMARRRARFFGVARPCGGGACTRRFTSRTAARNTWASSFGGAPAPGSFDRCLAMIFWSRRAGLPPLQYSPHGETRHIQAGC